MQLNLAARLISTCAVSSPPPPDSTRRARRPERGASFAEQLLARAPHYKSFAHITDSRRRRAMEIEQFLITLSELEPALAPLIEGYKSLYHDRAGRTHGSATEAVIKALEPTRGTGGAPLTFEDLKDDTNLPPTTLHDALTRLTDAGLVAIRTRPRSEGRNGRAGGVRNPEALYSLL
ncbi:MAG: hypothetical protein MSG64_16785 [Pyrinomonadaceae bacterium MAG19_C2-C3]|nr:hypothetical protein [Pyrinomonadaceae bacterium MAG19_C2-C3]